MPKSTEPVFVLSEACTHVLPDDDLVLAGGEVTPIPESLLAKVLTLPGVVQAFPSDPNLVKES